MRRTESLLSASRFDKLVLSDEEKLSLWVNERRMSQGQATRSTLTLLRVVHFIDELPILFRRDFQIVEVRH